MEERYIAMQDGKRLCWRQHDDRDYIEHVSFMKLDPVGQLKGWVGSTWSSPDRASSGLVDMYPSLV